LEETVTKEELTAAILACAAKKGRAPSRAQLLKETDVTQRHITKHFGTYQRALDACGLERQGCGQKIPMGQLFRDWTRVVRTFKKVPSVVEYEEQSKYSVRPLMRTFGIWSNVPDGMKFYAMEQGLAEEYGDVLEAIERRTSRKSRLPVLSTLMCGAQILTDRPMYGLPIQDCPLVYAPVNEQGVVYLFGALSERLGYLVLRVQTEFPDCEAMRVVEGKRMQRVRIEFEYESRNFLRHMHEPSGCDLIVCWEHNWPESPLEVVELKGVVTREIGSSPTARVIG
jgi:hypothetical protein